MRLSSFLNELNESKPKHDVYYVFLHGTYKKGDDTKHVVIPMTGTTKKEAQDFVVKNWTSKILPLFVKKHKLSKDPMYKHSAPNLAKLKGKKILAKVSIEPIRGLKKLSE